MANNFHDINGMLMVGLDRHFALLMPGVPVPFIPTPVPVMTKLNLLHPFSMGNKQRATVLFNGVQAVAHWHQPKFLWPHLGLPPFPFDILTPLQIALGVQTCWLPKTDVIAEGETLTPCAIYGPTSINLDCWDFANIPSSFILQPGTVQTTPTLADYKAGVAAVAVDFAMNIAFNLVLRGAGRLLRRGTDAAHRAVVRRFGPFPRGRTVRAIDRLFGSPRRRMRELARQNSLRVPHSNQGSAPTCQFHSLQNQMRFADRGRASNWRDLLEQGKQNGFTSNDRFGNGMHQWDAASLAQQNGWNVGTNPNAGWNDITGLVDNGTPVGAALPVDQLGLPNATGGQHAVIVKGHFVDDATEYVVVTHGWGNA
ncbi:MAG: C39 family peptidase, partial [Polyangiaceae bacterium]